MFKDLTFRMTTEDDADAILSLLNAKFGERRHYGVLHNLDGRYYVAVNATGEIIAMTGLNFKGSGYNGPEIDWTCVDDRYTNRGLMSKMISDIISDFNGNIYCSCWRNTYGEINLHHAMKVNGFIPIQVPRVVYRTDCNNCKDICVRYDTKDGSYCSCCEDLYIRPAK